MGIGTGGGGKLHVHNTATQKRLQDRLNFTADYITALTQRSIILPITSSVWTRLPVIDREKWWSTSTIWRLPHKKDTFRLRIPVTVTKKHWWPLHGNKTMRHFSKYLFLCCIEERVILAWTGMKSSLWSRIFHVVFTEHLAPINLNLIVAQQQNTLIAQERSASLQMILRSPWKPEGHPIFDEKPQVSARGLAGLHLQANHTSHALGHKSKYTRWMLML